MERLLDEVSFNAHQLKGQQIAVTRQYVQDKLHDIVKDEDLSRYIL
jgi:ATP-dependent HslUV protease ATP-binding subunit HslU